MRIIGGTHRSRTIHEPRHAPRRPGGEPTTRPITDRVKQALFDRLVTMETMGGNVADVFAGTGSLGLEALSRGADHVTFIERDREARKLLERNLAELRFEAPTSVMGVDALSVAWLAALSRKPLRLVFLDPPYRLMEDEKDAARIAGLIEAILPTMEEEGVLVLRTEEHVTPPKVGGWAGPESHKYGSMTVSFYQRPPSA